MKDTTKLRLKQTGAALKLFAGRNYLMLGYILAAVLMELTGIAVTSGRFYMTEPWIYLVFIALPCLVSLYLPNHKSRYSIFVTALGINFILDMIFIIIYDSTNTVFDFAMLNLRSDAMAIVESVPISFAYVFVSAIIISLYCTLGQLLRRRMPKPARGRTVYIVTSVLLAVAIGADSLLLYFANYKNNANDLTYRLYQTERGTYSNKGMIANFASELARGFWFSDIDVGDRNELGEFVYAETTELDETYGGIAEGYNVVTILCESFEWFTFLLDAERYPNGFYKLVGEHRSTAEVIADLHELYPNLYRLYESNSTVVLDNAHSLEKTDISENKSIIGNYPLYEYINYEYPTNTLPYSLPNTLKALYGIESNSFHDGYKTFYNRNVHHTHALGFESYTAMEDMDIADDDTGLGERNLDSEMMQACAADMFPTDRRFNTYITTITQHGQYAYRQNLKPYYDKMDELNILPYKADDDGNALRYYCAAGMDFDKAIGIMLDYLEEHGLADKTIITLFGDHNTYYQGISNYVKNIYSYKADNYTELYRVPVMIKVGEQNIGNPHIQKFTCVADIYPTILDLLGIKGFKNLMYGVSAFNDESSVLYSRAYDRFITDKLYFNSLSRITYRAADADEEYVAEVEQKCLTLLDKISHVNRLFAGNYFGGGNADTYYERLRQLNDK